MDNTNAKGVKFRGSACFLLMLVWRVFICCGYAFVCMLLAPAVSGFIFRCKK